MKLLITGTTGYVGGRLVPRLLERGYPLRVISRRPIQLAGRPWREHVEVIQGDVHKPETMFQAFHGIHTAFYMIPGSGRDAGAKQMDTTAARQFSRAASRAGVQRIIYLGGLGDPCTQLSNHLLARQQIAAALREGDLPVTEFRAAVIVGSGSTTFELIRYLTERIPILIMPSWGRSRIQPIAIKNVIDYLVAALADSQSLDATIDIGGPEILTFSDMMRIYARVRGLTRIILPWPMKMPQVSAYWTHLTTPLPSHIARRLINDLCNDVLLAAL